jgi:hypothetical protein
MTFIWPRAELRPKQVPELYRQLAASSEPGAVLEYPWVAVWRVNRAFYLYQEIHGREVVVAPARALLADDRLAFHNMVPGTPEGFLASRARWLVVHRNLSQEESRILPPVEIDPRHRNLFRTFGRHMTQRLTREWGKPDWIDRRIAVWDLERVRALTPRPPLPVRPSTPAPGEGEIEKHSSQVSPSPGEGEGESGEGAGG